MTAKENLSFVEYLWLDGAEPTQQLRSKTKIVHLTQTPTVKDLDPWSFDGSSTNQATGDNSDCVLQPVFVCRNPLRTGNHWITLCEVLNSDLSPHKTNHRAKLRKLMETHGSQHKPYVGFEQEYTFLDKQTPLGWPTNGFPGPQGPYYCGVGSGNVFGRSIVEQHMVACLDAELNIYGVNAEVMPGQWEFQMGYRGIDTETSDPLTMSDHLWIGRYLLCTLAERYSVEVSLANKPIKGDWNGAGMHTNFSTQSMRSSGTGSASIEEAVNKLAKTHDTDITQYGHLLGERLTGRHETCSLSEFKAGTSDRGASIRIPLATAQKGCGYIEDRRPGANANPYIVSSLLMESICS